MRTAFDFAGINTDFFIQIFNVHIRHIHANAAGKGRRIGINNVAVRSKPICRRSSLVAHGSYYRLFGGFFKPLQFAPHFFRGSYAAARRIYMQHQRFNAAVCRSFTDFFHQLAAGCSLRAAKQSLFNGSPVNNRAADINNGNPVANSYFRLIIVVAAQQRNNKRQNGNQQNGAYKNFFQHVFISLYAKSRPLNSLLFG